MKYRLKVLSYNIHKGFMTRNSEFILEEIRHAVREVNADLVFLQEVVGENIKHERKLHNWQPKQFEYLADDVWPHYAYGKNAIYSHGHHGNAILSKHPIEHFENIDVSIFPKSQRGILLGRLTTGLNVACIHFGLLGFERRYQISRLYDTLVDMIGNGEPLLLAGDFNDWMLSAHRSITTKLRLTEAYQNQHGKLARTFPSSRPLLPMDRIYVHKIHVNDIECLQGHPWNLLSDHCALTADISFG